MKSKHWYRSPYVILPAVAIVIAVWLLMRPGGQPSDAVAVQPRLVATGPNLLKNPSFLEGPAGWTVYHNAQPMAVSFDRKLSVATIGLTGVTNGVQELYQFVNMDRGTSFVASGEVDISRAPLPKGASVVAIAIDDSSQPQTMFGLGATSGVGRFPFNVSIVPDGALKQYVMAVIVGADSNGKTVVAFRNLSLRKAASAK